MCQVMYVHVIAIIKYSGTQISLFSLSYINPVDVENENLRVFYFVSVLFQLFTQHARPCYNTYGLCYGLSVRNDNVSW